MRTAVLFFCAIAGFGCGSGEAPALASSVVLITLDTTRADVLGSLGGPPGLTPNLDRLAEQSVVFTNARSVAPLTLPAHASMLTGLYPPRHTLRTNATYALPADASTLAERARAAGLETAAFVGAAVLDSRFGLDQGFELYDAPEFPDRPGVGTPTERPAAEVIGAARRWLAERDSSRPFFLWVHLFDAHAPYLPTAEAVERIKRLDLPAERRPYLAEVSVLDAEVGALLADLDARPESSRTLVLLTADHGESLGDHDESTHATLCFDTTIRVPLFVRLPATAQGHPRAGERLDAPVSVVDVFPTALEALGLGAPGSVDGASLLAPAPERGVYFESYDAFVAYGWSPLAGWADRDGKYLHSSRPLFFRPQTDPAEMTPVAAAEGDDFERYRRAIAAVAARPTLAEEVAAGGEQTRSQLQALGYTGASQSSGSLPHPLEPGDRPVPMDRTRDIHLLQSAAQLFDSGMAKNDMGTLARAAKQLAELVERNPEAWQYNEKLALSYGKLGRDAEAAQIYESLVATRPPESKLHNNLAVCYFNLGRTADALREAERALEIDPRNATGLRLKAHFQGALED